MKTTDGPWLEGALPRRFERADRDAPVDEDSLFAVASGVVAGLWRRRLMIVTIVVAAIVVVWVALMNVPSTYVAKAELYFDFSRQSVVSDLPAGVIAPSTAMLNTEMEILTSRSLLGVVVDDLDLTSDPEFNPLLLADPAEVAARPGGPPSEEEVRSGAVSRLLRQLRVTLVPNSYVFTISVESNDAEKSASIANSIAEIFIRERTRRRDTASEDAIAWLERRSELLRDRVRQAENRVDQNRAQASPGTQSSLTSMAMQIASLRERLAALRKTSSEDDASPEGASGLAAGASAEEAAVDAAGAGAAVASDDPAALGETGDRLDSAAQKARSQEAILQAGLDALMRAYSDRAAKAQMLRDSEREAAATQAAYEAMLQRLKGAAVDAIDPFWPEAAVISPAVAPADAASPDRKLILALSAMGSLSIACALALLLNALDPVVSSAAMLQRLTGAPVLAQIRLPARHTDVRKLQKRLKRNASAVLANGLHALRNAVAGADTDAPPRVVVLTAAEGDEGERVTGILLAQSLRQAGRKVLLIDATRQEATTVEHAAASPPQATRGAVAESDMSTSIRRDEASGVDILPSPQILPDDAGALAPEDVRAEFREVAAQYDVVVAVAPPLHERPETSILFQLSDVVAVVVRGGRSRPAAVTEAVELLAGEGARVGTVFLTSGRSI